MLRVTREDNRGFGTPTPHVGFEFFDDKENYHAGWMPKAIFETFPIWDHDEQIARKMKIKHKEIVL